MKVIIFTFVLLTSFNIALRAQVISGDTLLMNGRYPVYNSIEMDLNGDGSVDKVLLEIIEKEGDYNNFNLKINGQSISGALSYNVAGFMITDIDIQDDYKEISVYTPHPNGPDELIVYRYEGDDISKIGGFGTYANFLGDGSVDVTYFRPFWEQVDTYLFNPMNRVFERVGTYEYSINIESTILEPITIYPAIMSRGTSGSIDKGTRVKIASARLVPDCVKQGKYIDDACFYFYIEEIGTDRSGWASYDDVIKYLQLDLQP